MAAFSRTPSRASSAPAGAASGFTQISTGEPAASASTSAAGTSAKTRDAARRAVSFVVARDPQVGFACSTPAVGLGEGDVVRGADVADQQDEWPLVLCAGRGLRRCKLSPPRIDALQPRRADRNPRRAAASMNASMVSPLR